MKRLTLKKKAVVRPIADRMEAAHGSASLALATFEDAARDLDTAADDLADLAEEAQAEADRLQSLADSATDTETAHRARAERIRAIVL